MIERGSEYVCDRIKIHSTKKDSLDRQTIIITLIDGRDPGEVMWVAIFVFVGWIASVCLHEFGHAVVAYWGGDTSVKEKGYLTLNPLKYTNVSMSLVLPLIFLLLGGVPLPGAAVYINQQQLRNRWWQSAVSAAGPAATALVALLLSIPFKLGLEVPDADSIASWSRVREQWLWYAIAFLLVLQVAAVLLNLLPVPPFDGYGIIEPWLPVERQRQFRRWGQFGILVVFAALWLVPSANRAFWGIIYAIAAQLGVSASMALRGYVLFNQWAAALLVVTIGVVLLLQRFLNQPIWSETTPQSTTPQTIDPTIDPVSDREIELPQAKRLNRAIAVCDRQLARAPDNPQLWYQQGSLFWQWQHCQEQRAGAGAVSSKVSALEERSVSVSVEGYSQALAACDRAVAIQPHFYAAWYLQGLILQEMQWYKAALIALTEAVQLKPDSCEALYLKGTVLAQLQDWETAIATYDQVLQLQPENVAIWDSRGKALVELQRYEEAADAYDQALTLRPDDWPHIWANYGWVLGRLRRDEAAMAACKWALKLAPEDACLWYLKGLTLYELQRYEEAITACDQSIYLEPAFPDPWHRRGLALHQLGQHQRAIAAYRCALDLDPDATAVRVDLDHANLIASDLDAAD